MAKHYLFLALLLLSKVCFSSVPVIQRYGWVGCSKDGAIAAFMYTHFGPSSLSPFALLVIKQAGKSQPIYTDGAFLPSGGEKELSELAETILNRNKNILAKYNLDKKNKFVSEANIVFSADHKSGVVDGWIDIKNYGVDSFTIKPKALSCPDNPAAIGFEIYLSGKRKISSDEEYACVNDSFALRNVYRAQSALWFVLNMHSRGLGDIDAYWIDIEGVRL